MKVRVYRNLKHGASTRPLYSVLVNGRVAFRRHRVLLTDAVFLVNEGGRQRVLQEGRKNVHAFVAGTLVGSEGAFGIDANGPDLPMRVRYNPYKSSHFESDCGPVRAARGVLLNESGISACYLSWLGRVRHEELRMNEYDLAELLRRMAETLERIEQTLNDLKSNLEAA